jgi:hypothetical protein
MDPWIRLVVVSALALMVLGPTAIATGDLLEKTTPEINGWPGAFQPADIPNGNISKVSSIPGTMGGIEANPDLTTQRTFTGVIGPSVSGIAIFPLDHIWNTRVDSLPVDSRSADYVGTIGSTAYIHADFGSGLYEGTPIGIPYTIVNGSQPKKTVLFDYADESDPGPYPIPDNPLIEGGSDHHVLIIDRDHGPQVQGLFLISPVTRCDPLAGHQRMQPALPSFLVSSGMMKSVPGRLTMHFGLLPLQHEKHMSGLPVIMLHLLPIQPTRPWGRDSG